MNRLAVAIFATALWSGVARGDEPAPAQPAPPSSGWYGWQTLTADAAVAATWFVADRTSSDRHAELGALGYLLGTPLIHGAHGRIDSAFISLGLRLGAPIVGAMTGIMFESGRCTNPTANDEIVSLSPCEARGAVVGFFGAMIGVAIFDAARAFSSPATSTWVPHREPTFSFTPTFAPMGNGTAFGFAGRF